MFFILSKILSFVISPMLWIVGVFVYGIVTKKAKRKKKMLLIAFSLLVFFSNPLLSDVMFKWYERDAIAMNEIEQYDIGIILAGVVQTTMKPRDRVYFSKGADRVTHALQLYKEHRISKILVTGGTGFLIGEKVAEADLIRDFLLLAGVPDQDVIIENESRNTRENATNTAEIIQARFPSAKLVLITSAFHMNRAEGCFRKVGLEVKCFPTDFRTGPIDVNLGTLLVPSASAIDKWSLLIHEVVGFVVYKVRGFS